MFLERTYCRNLVFAISSLADNLPPLLIFKKECAEDEAASHQHI